jgi:hypothetical protein
VGRLQTDGKAGVRTPPPKHYRVAKHYAGLPRDDKVISKQSSALERNRRFYTAHASYHYRCIHFGTNGGCFYDNVTGVSKYLGAWWWLLFDFKTIRYETCSEVQCDQRIQNPWYGAIVAASEICTNSLFSKERIRRLCSQWLRRMSKTHRTKLQRQQQLLAEWQLPCWLHHHG